MSDFNVLQLKDSDSDSVDLLAYALVFDAFRLSAATAYFYSIF